nr:reverse transcriptase domain-containing protein [Tanacetum cinerariifolium]
KDLPRISRTRGSASKLTTTKSAGKWNVPTFTKTSSVIPTGLEIERSASSRVIHTRKALIDVYEGALTLRVSKEDITFNLNQTSRYSANYNDMTANRIDVIDMAREEYSQEVLGSYDVIACGKVAKIVNR